MQNMTTALSTPCSLPQSFLTEIKTFQINNKKNSKLHNLNKIQIKPNHDHHIILKKKSSYLPQQKQQQQFQHSIVPNKMNSSRIRHQNIDDFLSNYIQKPKIIRFNSTVSSSSKDDSVSICDESEKSSGIHSILSHLNTSIDLDPNKKYVYDRFGIIKADNSNSEDSDEARNDSSSLEKLIISKRGTIRGNFNRVKSSLKQLLKETHQVKTKANFLERDYEREEHEKIVIYTTSLQIVRHSYEDCKRVKKILQNHCVRYEEHDLFKCKDYQRELKFRLNMDTIDIPQVFFNGKQIGNCDQLESLSDQGYLNKIFKNLDKIKLRIYCGKCGGYRYVLCTYCNGSKKKYNNFTKLKCTICNEDGLLRCDSCLDQQE